jgi:hypothetical protein
MNRQAIFLRVESDSAEAEFRGRAKNANGDFAAIGDEKFLLARRCGRGIGRRFGGTHASWRIKTTNRRVQSNDGMTGNRNQALSGVIAKSSGELHFNSFFPHSKLLY